MCLFGQPFELYSGVGVVLSVDQVVRCFFWEGGYCLSTQTKLCAKFACLVSRVMIYVETCLEMLRSNSRSFWVGGSVVVDVVV